MSDTAPLDIGHGLTVALRLAEGLPGYEDGVPVGVLLTHARDTAPLDIGHGLTVALRLAEGLPGYEDGVPVGVLLTHACAKRGGEVVQDFIPVEPYPHVGGAWTLDQREPVTLSPSVHYTCCGVHGFIRAGAWIPA